MNYLQWLADAYSVRCELGGTCINIFGATHPCDIHLEADKNRLVVKYADKTEKIFLDDLRPVGNGSILMFQDCSPSGCPGALVIPLLNQTANDD